MGINSFSKTMEDIRSKLTLYHELSLYGRDLIFLVNLPFPSLPLGEISLFNIKFACITFFKHPIRISFKKVILHLQILSIQKNFLNFSPFLLVFILQAKWIPICPWPLPYRLDLIHSRPDVQTCTTAACLTPRQLLCLFVADGWCWFVMREQYCWLPGSWWLVLI